MHLWLSLPQKMEIGAVRADDWAADVVETDGGYDVRNTPWSTPLRQYHLALPIKAADDADFVALRAMWSNALGQVHSFNFTDWIDGDTVRVRFDGGLQFTTPKRMQLHHTDTFTLKQVRDVSPSPTVAPNITGTTTVGSTLTVHNGTWSGSPTSYAYQWQRNGVAIGGATAATYVLQAGDSGKLVGCSVTATDAYGGATITWAAEVGPIA